MIMNNLDPDVAERPQDLVVYGGSGRAARSWAAFDAIVRSLRELEDDETLLVQSGKPVGIFRTHASAPRVLIANSNLVPHWGNWDEFRRLEALGLTMYGQMTAGSWIYIGSQGIVQGTYETFAEAARQHFGGTLKGKFVLTAGLGGMGGAQPTPVKCCSTRPSRSSTCSESIHSAYGMQPAPDLIYRAFSAVGETRVLNKAGYVKFRNFLLYGEQGLAGCETLVNIFQETLTLEYDENPLSKYSVEWQPDERHLLRVGNPRLYQHPYQTPQLPLWEPCEVEWHVIIRCQPQLRHRKRGVRSLIIPLPLFQISDGTQGR